MSLTPYGARMTDVKPSTVIGVPRIPPPVFTTAGNRMRAVLGRAHAGMAPPPLRILEGLFGMLDHRVLVALCEAGVPDALTGPTTVDALAEQVGAESELLGRLLRFGATKGWVRFDRRGRVRPTRVTTFLRRDHPGGWRAWVDFAGGDEVVAAVSALGRRPGDAFAAANGLNFFDWMGQHPDRSDAFNRAMAAGARMHALTLDAVFDFGTVGSVCDVGGGTGELVRVLLDRHPSLRATVLDLPSVAEAARPHERLSSLGGDAFVEVPSGFDAYLFVNVIHDWGDDDAVRLLSSTARAVGDTDGRVLVLDSDAGAWRHNTVAVAADLMMAATAPGGRERTVEEFAALGQAAGLRLVRTMRLASGDVAHEFVRTGR